MNATRFDLDYLAEALAVADDESWHGLESDQRDGYRRLARVAYDTVVSTDAPELHEDCYADEDLDQAAKDGFEQARERILAGISTLRVRREITISEGDFPKIATRVRAMRWEPRT